MWEQAAWWAGIMPKESQKYVMLLWEQWELWEQNRIFIERL